MLFPTDLDHATTCGTLIIPCSSNIRDSLTHPKTSRKCTKRLKVLKKDNLL